MEREYDFDLVVIGSGPAGYVAAIKAVKLGMTVACVEKEDKLGGTCLRVGCIPSKALLYATELLFTVQTKGEFFGYRPSGEVSFDKLQASKDKSVAEISSGIDLLFERGKITRFKGNASFQDPHTILIKGNEEKAISGNNILIATGSEAASLPFLPFDEKRVVSSTGALHLDHIPSTMTVIGAGAIGLELASVYARLGTKVEVVEVLPRIAPFLDKEMSKVLQKCLEKQGLKFTLEAKVVSANLEEGAALQIETGGEQRELVSEVVLVSVGRKPYTEGLLLEKAGIVLNEKGQIPVQSDFSTAVSHIFAIGDVIDGPMLAHKASEEAVAAVECMAGNSCIVDYAAIPNVVYTYPEACAVGLTEEQAANYGLSFVKGTAKFASNPRAKACFQEEGLCKVLAEKKSGKVLGLHIIGAHSSEMIQLGALAVKERLHIDQLAYTCAPHPTLSEALKEACLQLLDKQIHG